MKSAFLVIGIILLSCGQDKKDDESSNITSDPAATESSTNDVMIMTVAGSCAVPASGNTSSYCKQYADDFNDIEDEKTSCERNSGTWSETKCALGSASFYCAIQTTSESNVETKATVYYSDTPAELVEKIKETCVDASGTKSYWEKY